MEPSATSTMVTGPVGEHLQTGSEDAFSTAQHQLRRFHDSGAGYKYPDLLTYLQNAVWGEKLTSFYLHKNFLVKLFCFDTFLAYSLYLRNSNHLMVLYPR